MGIEECYSKILKNEGAVNSAKLKNAFLGMESGELTFFKFYEQFLSDYEKKVNSGLPVNGTRSKYKILLKHLRNLFVFSCFIGLSYSDMKGLKTSNIQDFFDGNQWIIERRKKTATSSNVMLLDIPKMIIEKYAGFSKDGKVFPVPSNTVCNDSLKRISQQIDCLKESYLSSGTAHFCYAVFKRGCSARKYKQNART